MKDKFKHFGKYRFNRRLGRVCFTLALLLMVPALSLTLLAGLFGDGWVAFSCEPSSLTASSIGSCENPVFNKCRLVNNNPVCHEEFIPIGFEYNVHKGMNTYQLPVAILILIFFLVNHWKYNKGVLTDER